MDPFLEGELWPDVHHSLATKLRNMLAPSLHPKYVARLELYTVQDEHPEEEVGIMYPDVEVLRPHPAVEGSPSGTDQTATPATLSLREIAPVAVRIPLVEIRTVEGMQLVTAIEILSPVNKRKGGWENYQKKRRELKNAHIHLLEIDLLRRGQRVIQHPNLPVSDYLICLSRAGSLQTDIWAIDLPSPLPSVPVPLQAPDPDLAIGLGAALREIYDEAFYGASLDYSKAPPPPDIREAFAGWMQELLAAYKR